MMDAAGTRERIVTAARRLFAEKGFDGATTAAIARAAGVAEGSIYRHFASKEDLFLTCVAPALAPGFLEQWQARLLAAPDLRTMARAAVEVRIQFIQDNMESFNILFGEMPYHPELAQMYLERHLVDLIRQMAPTFQRVLDAGLIRRTPSFLILGVGLTVMIWSILRLQDRVPSLPLPIPMGSGNLVDDLTDFVLHGLAGQPPGGEG